MRRRPVDRRTALRLCGASLVAGLAGCLGTDDGTPTVGSGDGSGSGGDGGDGTDGGSGDGGGGGSKGTPTDTVSPGPGDGGDTAMGTPGGADSVTASRVASGFTSPLGLEIPQAGRRYVVDQVGEIRLQADGDLLTEPFLDVTDRMVSVSGYSERGLLGLAFHPEYADNGRFFVRYSAPARAGTPSNYSHTFVLSEFSAEPGSNRADPDSERTVLEIPQPQGNHNAGAITFGPDGYLYVAVGDGGAANDRGRGHVDDWYDGVGGGNGQDVTENLLGSILRIDVDGEPSGTDREGENARNYAVPSDNPLVGGEGLDEQYAWGFRNPWRMTFGPEGRLFAGDVGQGAWEEVDIVEAGGNYGWNVREGTHCFSADDCPSETPDGQSLVDPVVEYPHGGQPVSGVTVIGGYLYDGADVPALEDEYVFADWQARGRLFAAREREDGLWPTRVVSVDSDAEFGPNVLSFGRNPDGELFVCTTARTGVTGSSGAVFRLGSE